MVVSLHSSSKMGRKISSKSYEIFPVAACVVLSIGRPGIPS